MDPVSVLSLIGTALSGTQQCAQTAYKLYAFIQSAKNVSESVKSLQNEISQVGNVCSSVEEQLRLLPKDASTNTSHQTLLTVIDSQLTGCIAIIVKIQDSIQTISQDGKNFVQQSLRQIKLNLKQEDIDDCRKQIISCTLNLSISLQLVNLQAVHLAPKLANQDLLVRLDTLQETLNAQGQRLDNSLKQCADTYVARGTTLYAESVAGASVLGDQFEPGTVSGWLDQLRALELDEHSEAIPVFEDSNESVSRIESALSTEPTEISDDEDELTIESANAAYTIGNSAYDKLDHKEAINMLQECLTLMQTLPSRHRTLDLEEIHLKLAISTCYDGYLVAPTGEAALVSAIGRGLRSNNNAELYLSASQLLARQYIITNKIEMARSTCESIYKASSKLYGKDDRRRSIALVLLMRCHEINKNQARANVLRSLIPKDHETGLFEEVERLLISPKSDSQVLVLDREPLLVSSSVPDLAGKAEVQNVDKKKPIRPPVASTQEQRSRIVQNHASGSYDTTSSLITKNLGQHDELAAEKADQTADSSHAILLRGNWARMNKLVKLQSSYRPGSFVEVMNCTHDGQTFACSYYSSTVKRRLISLFDIDWKHKLTIAADADRMPQCLAFSRDGTVLASGYNESAEPKTFLTTHSKALKAMICTYDTHSGKSMRCIFPDFKRPKGSRLIFRELIFRGSNELICVYLLGYLQGVTAVQGLPRSGYAILRLDRAEVIHAKDLAYGQVKFSQDYASSAAVSYNDNEIATYNLHGSGELVGVSKNVGSPQTARIKNAVMPPGWEKRTEVSGRNYYVNHISRSTSLVLPPDTLPYHDFAWNSGSNIKCLQLDGGIRVLHVAYMLASTKITSKTMKGLFNIADSSLTASAMAHTSDNLLVLALAIADQSRDAIYLAAPEIDFLQVLVLQSSMNLQFSEDCKFLFALVDAERMIHRWSLQEILPYKEILRWKLRKREREFNTRFDDTVS